MMNDAIEQLQAALAAVAQASLTDGSHGDDLIKLCALQSQLEAEIARRTEALRVSADWALDGAASPAGWIRFHTRTSRRDAQRRVRLAKTAGELPLTAAAWATGTISSAHADVIVRVATKANAPELFAEYEPCLLEIAATHSPEETLAVASVWLEALHNHLNRDVAAQSDADTESPNQAWLSRTFDDATVLDATFDAEGGEYVRVAIDRAYALLHRENDERSAAQQRADAIVEICKRYLEGLSPTGNRPHVLLINDLDVHEGFVIGRGRTGSGARIATETVQRHLCSSDFSTLDVANGVPLNLGTTHRLFTKHQVRAMTARDQTCRGPDCNVAASRCSAHHLRPWKPDPHDPDAEVGPTDLDNGILACWRCHRGMHEGGWTVRGSANSTLTFHHPDGRLLGTSTPKRLAHTFLTRDGEHRAALHARLLDLRQAFIHHREPGNQTDSSNN